MAKSTMTRREFVAGTGAMATAAAVGFKPRVTIAQGPRTLNVRLVRDIQVLDPGYMIGGAEITTQYAVLPRLAQVPAGDTWQWVPSAYVTNIGHTDDLHIAFTLKPGLMWSNGYGELTADDVKFSFERMKKSEWKGKWESLDHVEIVDKYSGVLVLNKPFAPLWLTAIARSTGAIVSKAAFEAKGITQFTTDIPAQLGPYQIREWRPKDRLIFERNPNWPLDDPHYDVINYINIDDDNAAELAYEAGEVEITEVTPIRSYPTFACARPSSTRSTPTPYSTRLMAVSRQSRTASCPPA